VYAGTGEPTINLDAYAGVGVLASSDAGATWHRVGGDELQLEPGKGDEDDRGEDRQLPGEGDAEGRSRQRLDDDEGEPREKGGRGDVRPARLAHGSDKE